MRDRSELGHPGVGAAALMGAPIVIPLLIVSNPIRYVAGSWRGGRGGSLVFSHAGIPFTRFMLPASGVPGIPARSTITLAIWQAPDGVCRVLAISDSIRPTPGDQRDRGGAYSPLVSEYQT